MIRPHR